METKGPKDTAVTAMQGADRGSRSRTCIACGEEMPRLGRRYCSPECRQQMHWVLSLSKGLLVTFHARYAAFFFTSDRVILDVLPVWSKEISRFDCRRSHGTKPAVDLKHLILNSGKEWYRLLRKNNSSGYASLFLLRQNPREERETEDIKPNMSVAARLTRQEIHSLKVLNLSPNDLSRSSSLLRIKESYRTLAKLLHPDLGGDEEKFKHLNEAHKQMMLWAENPRFSSRKALRHCWSYDGGANRWSPPL